MCVCVYTYGICLNSVGIYFFKPHVLFVSWLFLELSFQASQNRSELTWRCQNVDPSNKRHTSQYIYIHTDSTTSNYYITTIYANVYIILCRYIIYGYAHSMYAYMNIVYTS